MYVIFSEYDIHEMDITIMTNSFAPLIETKKLVNGFRQTFSINNMQLLLIHEKNKTYLLENKCGHFGVVLEDAKLGLDEDKAVIICQQHGISFDLATGEVVNRPWESCDPIKILNVVIENDMLGFKQEEQN